MTCVLFIYYLFNPLCSIFYIQQQVNSENETLFISTNSSFIECLRNKNKYIFHTIHPIQNYQLLLRQVNSPCSDTYWEDCSSVPRQSLTSATSFTFKKCSFNSLSDTSGEGGGAIFFNNEDGDIIVEACHFLSCESSSLGGAIFISSSSSFNLYSSI